MEDLRSFGITPSRTNSTYQLDVRIWLWQEIILELDLPMYCRSVDDWVEKFSVKFTDEAKRIWEITKGTYRTVLKKFKNFVEKTVEFPGKASVFTNVFIFATNTTFTDSMQTVFRVHYSGNYISS